MSELNLKDLHVFTQIVAITQRQSIESFVVEVQVSDIVVFLVCCVFLIKFVGS